MLYEIDTINGLSKKISWAWHWGVGATKIRPPTTLGAQIHTNTCEQRGCQNFLGHIEDFGEEVTFEQELVG